MSDFLYYLNKIQYLIKAKQYDQAWALSNQGVLKIKGEDRFMMYYQMAIIAAREKRWLNALEKMGFVIYYLRGLGGVTHKKFTLRLLKKFKKENLIDEYIDIAINTHPRDLANRLSSFLSIT